MRRVLCVYVLAGLAALSLSALSHAVLPGMKILDLVIDPPTWETISTELNLSEETQLSLHPLWAEYWTAIQSLDAQTYQNTLDAGFQEIIDMVEAQEAAGHQLERAPGRGEATRGGPSDAEVFARQSELSYAFEMAMLQGRLHADQLLNMLMENLQEAGPLSNEQIAKMARITRRQNILRGFTKTVGPANDDNFERPLDLFEVVEQASSGGGEITLLKNQTELKQAEDGNAKDDRLESSPLAEILETYELQLDPLWQKQMIRARRTPEKNPPAVLRQGEPEFEERWERERKAWNIKYEAFALGAELIRQRIEKTLDEEVASRWEDRVAEYLCPELFDSVWFDDVGQWITGQPDTTPEQIAAAVQLQIEFVQEQRQLRRQTILAGVLAMKRHGTVLGSETEQESYRHSLNDLSFLSLRKIKKLKMILAPEQFESVCSEVKAGLPATLGPASVMSVALTDEFEEFFGSYDDYWRAQKNARRKPTD